VISSLIDRSGASILSTTIRRLSAALLSSQRQQRLTKISPRVWRKIPLHLLTGAATNPIPRLRQVAHNVFHQYQGFLALPASEFYLLYDASSYLQILLLRNCLRRGRECVYPPRVPRVPRRRRKMADAAPVVGH
jgi:hypothetical protein